MLYPRLGAWRVPRDIYQLGFAALDAVYASLSTNLQ